MPSEDRDQQFERALARHLRGAEPDAACPDPETLAAYHERTLSLDEMTRWKEHIAGCARCQEALALVEQSESVLAEGWQGEKVLAGMTAVRAAEAVPLTKSHEESAQDMAGSALPRAKAMETRKPSRLNKWTAPIGAIAATLLIGIGWYELRSTREKAGTSVQVAENRKTQTQDRVVPSQERAPSATTEKKAEAAQAPAKVSKTKEGPGIGGGIGGGMMSREEPSIPPKSAANSSARQDGRNYEADQLSANAAAPPPASPAMALPPAERSRATTQAMAAKGATGGPLVSNQANQQANQNDNLAMKKEETQKQKDQASSVEVSALSTGVMTSSAPISLRDMAIQTPSVIVAPDGKNAWRVGAGGKIEHSGNGGVSWKAQTSGVTQDLIAGTAPSKKICWMVGKSGTILQTTDGGKHWTRILSPITGDLGGVHAQDALHASIWDVANRETYETSDGGATWKSTASE